MRRDPLGHHVPITTLIPPQADDSRALWLQLGHLKRIKRDRGSNQLFIILQTREAFEALDVSPRSTRVSPGSDLGPFIFDIPGYVLRWVYPRCLICVSGEMVAGGGPGRLDPGLQPHPHGATGEQPHPSQPFRGGRSGSPHIQSEGSEVAVSEIWALVFSSRFPSRCLCVISLSAGAAVSAGDQGGARRDERAVASQLPPGVRVE